MHPERPPNPDRSAEALEARLRALPRPPVPDGLEARLLATIPAARPVPRRRGAAGAGAPPARAAACWRAVLAGRGRDGNNPVPRPGTGEPVRQATPRPPDDADSIAVWRRARGVLEGAEPPAFTW